jgi:hypothetical protein
MQQGENSAIMPATVAATREPPKKTPVIRGSLLSTRHYDTVVANDRPPGDANLRLREPRRSQREQHAVSEERESRRGQDQRSPERGLAALSPKAEDALATEGVGGQCGDEDAAVQRPDGQDGGQRGEADAGCK